MQDQLDRLHFMDSMRAILMVLGVVLHSAVVFHPNKDWIVNSEKTSAILGYLVDIITTFRMPAFFVVSGYFCFLTLRKYKFRKFISVRLTRIVVPLIVTLITLNLLQSLFLDWMGMRAPLAEYIKSARYISHLWFLVALIFYFLITALLSLAPRPIINLIKDYTGKLFTHIPIIAIIFILPLFTVALMAVLGSGLYYKNYFGFISSFYIFSYVPFFAFGVLIGIHKDTLKKFSTISPMACFAIIIVALVWLSLIKNADGFIAQTAVAYLTKLIEWASVLVVFYLFYRFFNTQSKTSRLLSESSYTIYLFHHLFVVIGATILVHYNFPALPGAIVLIVSITAITLAIHVFLISKVKVLSFLYNGK